MGVLGLAAKFLSGAAETSFEAVVPVAEVAAGTSTAVAETVGTVAGITAEAVAPIAETAAVATETTAGLAPDLVAADAVEKLIPVAETGGTELAGTAQFVGTEFPGASNSGLPTTEAVTLENTAAQPAPSVTELAGTAQSTAAETVVSNATGEAPSVPTTSSEASGGNQAGADANSAQEAQTENGADPEDKKPPEKTEEERKEEEATRLMGELQEVYDILKSHEQDKQAIESSIEGALSESVQQKTEQIESTKRSLNEIIIQLESIIPYVSALTAFQIRGVIHLSRSVSL